MHIEFYQFAKVNSDDKYTELVPIVLFDANFTKQYSIEFEDIMVSMSLVISDYVGGFEERVIPQIKKAFGYECGVT